MLETFWEDVRGEEVRYRDHTWRLTGDVEVRRRGELLAVEAYQVDDVRHERARLLFGLQSPTRSLNPGNLGQHFDRLERRGDDQYLVVRRPPRTYWYELHRLEFV